MSILGTVARAVVLAPAAWIGYSRFGVNHDVRLPKAIDADQKSIRTVAAGEVSYYVDESGSGRPLVLIHSINAAANPQEMQPLFDHYRGQRPVYAIDMPGFGFSDRSDRTYSPELYAGAIAEFLSGVVGKPADVVALSLSCEFVAIAARRNAELFASLAFISPTGLSADDEGSRSESAQRTGRSEKLYQAFSVPLWSQAFYDLLVTKPSLKYYSPGDEDTQVPADADEYSWKTAHQPGAKNAPLYFVSGKLFTPSIADDYYAKLKVPTMAIYGKGQFVSFEKMPKLTAENEAWHSVRFDDVGPLIHQEIPAIVTATLDEFWKRSDADTKS